MQKTLFATALERHGNRIALVDGDGTAPSFATLATLADRLMLETSQAQVGLIEFAHTIDTIAAYLGALRHGLPVILTSPGQPERTAALIDRFRPDCVFRDGHWINLPASNWREPPPHPNLAILLSTSGSTGDPRLVRLSHGNIQSNADAIVAYLGLRPSDRAITALPLHHGFGLSVLHAQLAVGGSLIVTETRIGTQAFQALCFRHRSTIIATVPYGYDLLERTGFMDDCPSTLRVLQQAGGRMEPEAVLRWARWARASGRRFFVMYGQTEASPRMAWLPPDQAITHPDCIGSAIDGGTFALRDEQGAAISGTGIPGELVYRGPNVMMGYAERRSDLSLRPGPAILATGDIAERVDDDLYRIIGRSSRFVKPYGFRVSLDMIERRLAGASVAGDDGLIAIVLPQGDPQAIAADLAAWLQLPPSLFSITIGEIPRLGYGKPDYTAILKAARAAREEAPALEPLRRLYADVGALARVDDGASFSSIGGDSLSHVQTTLAIEKMVGHLPPGWEMMPLREIATLPADAARPSGKQMQVDANLVLRAFAMIEIVFLHAHLVQAAGGAELLIFLAGISFFRLRRVDIREGRTLAGVWTFARSFILPYYLLLLAWSVATRQFDPAQFLLVGNYFGRFGSILEPYWFLEALLQCLLLTALLTRLPVLRRSPMRMLAALFLIGIVARLTSLAVEPHGLANRTAESVYYLFGGGMAFAALTGRRRLLVAPVLLLLSTLSWGVGSTQPLWLAIAIAMLVLTPRMSLPRPIGKPITAIAAASYHIYLVHSVVIWFIVRLVGWHGGLIAAIASFAAGLGLRHLSERLGRRV